VEVLKALDRYLKDGNLLTVNEAQQTATKAKITLMKSEVQNYLDSWK